MISALAYLQFTSTRNRLVARLKRLRQPKYLVGGVVGGLYIYFYFLRYAFLDPNGSGAGLSAWTRPENRLLVECSAGLILAIVAVLAWVLPNKRAALTFTEAEIAFLFPAPVSRRTLIQFKLFRSQLGILFTVLIFSLLSRRLGGSPLVHALGWWVVLSVLNLHFMGVSFVRTMLLDRGITTGRRRWAVGVLVGLVGLGCGVWVWRSVSAVDLAVSPEQLLEQWTLLATTGPLPVLTYPFRLVVRPYLAADLAEFVRLAWPAMLLLLAHYVFVLRADVAFEEASVEASRRLAERMAAARSGQRHAQGLSRPRRAPFALAPVGSPLVALFWKNLIGAGQFVNKRLLVVLVIMAVVASVSMGGSLVSAGLGGIIGILALMFLVWSMLLGPQVLAQDFRQDLKMADLLKMYPMGGGQVVLGELLAPAVILTVLQWLLIPLALGGVMSLDPEGGLPLDVGVGVAVALAIMAPAINLLCFVIPNASVLLFPAWFQADKSVPHGLETMGQRIILLFGQMLVLLLSAIPAGVVFAIVLALGRLVVGWLLAAPVAAVAAVAVLGVEIAVAVTAMGRWYDRLDAGET